VGVAFEPGEGGREGGNRLLREEVEEE